MDNNRYSILSEKNWDPVDWKPNQDGDQSEKVGKKLVVLQHKKDKRMRKETSRGGPIYSNWGKRTPTFRPVGGLWQADPLCGSVSSELKLEAVTALVRGSRFASLLSKSINDEVDTMTKSIHARSTDPTCQENQRQNKDGRLSGKVKKEAGCTVYWVRGPCVRIESDRKTENLKATDIESLKVPAQAVAKWQPSWLDNLLIFNNKCYNCHFI